MNTIGIDPGLKGSIAVLDDAGRLLELLDMPVRRVTRSKLDLDERTLYRVLLAAGAFSARVVVEEAFVMPKQGSSSGFKTGVGFGKILGTLAAMGAAYLIVRPQQWQQAVLGSVPRGESKERAAIFAGRMFPEADLGGRKSNDRADALCLAVYGQRCWPSARQAPQDGSGDAIEYRLGE